MAKEFLTLKKQTIVDIANAVRLKTNSDKTIKVEDLDSAIGEIKPTGELEITANGEYDVVDCAKIIVNVSNGGYSVQIRNGGDSYTGAASITYTDDTGTHTITTEETQLENVKYIKVNSVFSDYWGDTITDAEILANNGIIYCEPYTSEQLLAGVNLTKDITIGVYVSCLIEGTPITLANNSYKPIQDITYEDDLLVWDFDNGCFASAKPIWIQQERKAIEYNHLVFSDGSELNTVNQHRIFNVEKGMFTYPMTDDTPIGTTTFNDKGEYVTLVSKEVIKEEVNYYNIITDYHINLFAGSILTSCRLSNIYPIENMKYIKDNRDIIDYEEFNNIPIEYYYGLRLGEQPTDINRDGAVSFGDTSVEDYVKRLINTKKE